MKKAVTGSLMLLSLYSLKGMENEPTKQTISFQENKGQVYDQYNNPRPDVLFSGNNNGLVYHLTNKGISYQLNKIKSWKDVSDKKSISKQQAPDQISIYRVDFSWEGANENAVVQKGREYEGTANYYLSSDASGIMNVKSYKDILYKNIYQGIDLKWYEKNQGLEYDFILQPHANYNQIKIKISGAEKISINTNGELEIKTPLGTIIEKSPIAYQGSNSVNAEWIVEGNTVKFKLGNYDQNAPLVIDPQVRVWGTYYGGGFTEQFRTVDVDGSGNVYVAGYTTGNAGGTIIATVGAHQTTYQAGNDAVISKFNSAGTRLWGTYYGGSGNDVIYKCAVEAGGNIYVVGTTATPSSTLIASAGSHQTAFGGGASDAFVAKFNTSGTRLWSTYYGGLGDEDGLGCALDGSGGVYICGTTTSTLGISSAGSHQSTYGTNEDAFLVRFNSSGVRQWGTFYGGTSNDWGASCAVDATGNVYLCGSSYNFSSASAIVTTGAHQVTPENVMNSFLVKFNSSGVRQWGTYHCDDSDDYAMDCVTDASGNVFMAGKTSAPTYNGGTLISTPGAHQTMCAGSLGSWDGYLVKFNTNGVRQWGTYYGGSDIDNNNGCSLATDAGGNVYMCGDARSNSAITTIGTYQSVSGGSYDAYVVKFNPTGVRQWGTYYGGTSADYGFACAIDGQSIYIAGSTSTGTGTAISSTGSHQTVYGGGTNDAFLAKLYECQTLTLNVAGTSTVCLGQSATLSASGTGFTTYTWSTGANTTSISVTPTTTTNYTLTAGTATAGCNYIDIHTVSLAITPTVLISSTVTSCAGAPVSLTASGAATYTWSTGATTTSITVNPTVTTTYTVNGTAANSCTDTHTRTINVIANPTVNITASSSSLCVGSSATLTASGAFTYSWSTGGTNPSISVSPTVTTIYTATGTDANGCVNTKTISISTSPNPTVNISAGSTSVCPGSSVTLSASGASTYTWSTGGVGNSVSVSPTVNTVYTATGTAVSGCKSTNTISISVGTNPTVNISASTSSVCSGSASTLTASGASTYTWSTGGIGSSISVTPSVTTVYTATGTAVTGCRSTKTISINVVTTPTLSVNNYTICAGGTATLLASGASTYSWNTGATTSSILVTPSSNTNYTVTGVNGGSCSNTRTLSVTVGSAISIALTPSSSTICIGNTGTITASGATSYTWNTGSNASSIIITPTTATTYTVAGTSGSCSGTNTISISVSPNPTIAASSSSSLICLGNSATLSVSGANSYNWNPGSLTGSSVVVSPTSNTTYTVIGSNSAGCTHTQTLALVVSACTGLNEVQLQNASILIFPNPNNGDFTISVPENGYYTIVNSIGQAVETIEVKDNSQTISVTSLADGIYYLIGKSAKAKIIVNK